MTYDKDYQEPPIISSVFCSKKCRLAISPASNKYRNKKKALRVPAAKQKKESYKIDILETKQRYRKPKFLLEETKRHLKETYSESEIDNFRGNVITFTDIAMSKIYAKALRYIKRNGGTLYTMVDGEDNRTHYLKGLRLVNRFGFAVLKE
jgi:hypothetical protein